jgi:hypothetical protein
MAMTENNLPDEMTKDKLEAEIRQYEQMHGFSSEKLLEMVAKGEHPDTFEIQAWITLLKYR